MVFPTRWRKEFTAIFILTASVSGPSPAAAQDCVQRLAGVEHAMQDGLGDLSRARNLLEEALRGIDHASADDAQTCGFLKGSHDAYSTALGHFQQCVTRTDSALSDCPGASWTDISANPALCETRVAEIDKQLSKMPGDIARFCGE